MSDREKVINEYEDYVNSYISLTTSHDYEFEMHKAVLALLQEQEDEIAKFCGEVARLTAMLKEQEAKEGHWIVLEFCANEGIYCSECHMKIFDRITKPKKKLSQYCPHCGTRNEQFFRDDEVVFR